MEQYQPYAYVPSPATLGYATVCNSPEILDLCVDQDTGEDETCGKRSSAK